MSKKPRTPWISKGLLVSDRKENRLYKKIVKHPTPTLETQYKAYKNKLIHLTRIAKRTYYNDNKIRTIKK